MDNAAPAEPSHATPASSAESTARYLLKRLCADHGHHLGTVEEARALAEAADFALTHSDGMAFQLILVIDREQAETRTFALPLEAIVTAGKACLPYAGKIQRTQLPVAIQILEVGHGLPSEADRQRLRRISRAMPGLQKVSVICFAADIDSGHVWTSARFAGFTRRHYLERVLREPRKADDQLLRPTLALRESVTPPLCTYALLGVLLLGFIAELVWGVRPWTGLLQPDIETLIAFGGLAKPLILEGQWYRLLTAAFLHADAAHLALNAVALFIGASLLERLFGRLWLLALFVLGALGGSALSLALNAPNVVSVGASGSIMGLLAAASAASFRLPKGPDRTRMHMLLMQMLIPSLIPIAWHESGGQIDFASHLGGAITGTSVGVFLLKTWPTTDPLPRFRGAALATALAGSLLLAFGLAEVASTHAEYVRRDAYASLLIPNAELIGEEEKLLAASEGFVTRYPRDPRGHFFRGVRLAREGELGLAEGELRTALGEKDVLENYFDDRSLEIELRSVLAAILIQSGNQPEAVLAAAPVCSAGTEGQVPERLRPLNVCP